MRRGCGVRSIIVNGRCRPRVRLRSTGMLYKAALSSRKGFSFSSSQSFNPFNSSDTYTLLFKTNKMKLSILSTLAVVTLGYALPQELTKTECVKPYLCCGELKTPLDSTVDPILKTLGINAANIVGSIGLDCMPFPISHNIIIPIEWVDADLNRQGVRQVLQQRS